MALILVVEPDTARAEQVTALARTAIRAEVIAVRSAEDACAVVADSVPDVVLLSTLLSAHDEGRIAAELRALGAEARHVQLLTIPIVTPRARREPARRGLLSMVLRRRNGNPVDQPAAEWELFARRVAEYAELAVASRPERPQREEPRLHMPLLPPTEPVAARSEAEIEDVPMTPHDVLAPPFDAAPAPAGDERDWIPLDLTALADEPVPDIPVPNNTPRPVPNSTPRAGRPVADEWGVFDPQQCGFAALLARLDELAGSGDTAVDDAATNRAID